MQGARTMVIDGKLPAEEWPFAVKAFIHIYNRSHNSALGKGETPYSIISKQGQLGLPTEEHKPSITHLRRYGCAAFVNISKERRV